VVVSGCEMTDTTVLSVVSILNLASGALKLASLYLNVPSRVIHPLNDPNSTVSNTQLSNFIVPETRELKFNVVIVLSVKSSVPEPRELKFNVIIVFPVKTRVPEPMELKFNVVIILSVKSMVSETRELKSNVVIVFSVKFSIPETRALKSNVVIVLLVNVAEKALVGPLVVPVALVVPVNKDISNKPILVLPIHDIFPPSVVNLFKI